jgi:hypothetical protein
MIKPPRALWVPFDLGRPLGPPNNAAFQRQVLTALLKLLEAIAGPLLVDFPDDEPESSDELVVPAFPEFSCQTKGEISKTDNLEAAFRREITSLRALVVSASRLWGSLFVLSRQTENRRIPAKTLTWPTW